MQRRSRTFDAHFKMPKDLYGTLNGSYVGKLSNGTWYAGGWGSDFDLDLLQKKLPAR